MEDALYEMIYTVCSGYLVAATAKRKKDALLLTWLQEEVQREDSDLDLISSTLSVKLSYGVIITLVFSHVTPTTNFRNVPMRSPTLVGDSKVPSRKDSNALKGSPVFWPFV